MHRFLQRHARVAAHPVLVRLRGMTVIRWIEIVGADVRHTALVIYSFNSDERHHRDDRGHGDMFPSMETIAACSTRSPSAMTAASMN
jgi:hypothetical protein